MTEKTLPENHSKADDGSGERETSTASSRATGRRMNMPDPIKIRRTTMTMVLSGFTALSAKLTLKLTFPNECDEARAHDRQYDFDSEGKSSFQDFVKELTISHDFWSPELTGLDVAAASSPAPMRPAPILPAAFAEYPYGVKI
jgi:hypothetical protein